MFVQKLIYLQAMCISTVALLILEFNEIEPALNLTCVWSHNLLFCVCHGKVKEAVSGRIVTAAPSHYCLDSWKQSFDSPLCLTARIGLRSQTAALFDLVFITDSSVYNENTKRGKLN